MLATNRSGERRSADGGRTGFAILVENLVMSFGEVKAVDGISFAVGRGEIFGLLGPNGAGKTTTINVLATLLKPTSGRAEVAGHDVGRSRDSVRRSIGIVFQEPALDGKLTGRENLEFHALMYGLSRTACRRKVDEVLALVELTDKSGALVENYSGGMKRRLEIARGLIHRPDVLFLDEPTLGLDAQTRRRIWEYIRQLNRETGVTIILTTHYMEEADFLCRRVAIMDHGRFAAQDTPARLKDLLGGDVVSLEFERRAGEMLAEAEKLPWVKTSRAHDGCLSLTMERGERRIPELIALAQARGITVNSVHLHKPSLEDVFLHFTGRTIRDREAGPAEKARAGLRGHGGRRR
jgi:ABC-2 type transport system ATP-binding protein